MVSVALAVVAVVTLVVPPISFFMSLIGLSFGSTAWLTSPQRSESRSVARTATAASGAALAALIVGGLIVSALT